MSLFTSDVLLGLLVGTGGGGGIGWWFAWRRDRREDTTTQVDNTVTLLQQLATLQTRTSTLAEEVMSLQLALGQAQLTLQTALGGAAVLVAWIDNGCPDPPPTIPPALRKLVEAAQHTHLEVP